MSKSFATSGEEEGVRRFLDVDSVSESSGKERANLIQVGLDEGVHEAPGDDDGRGAMKGESLVLVDVDDTPLSMDFSTAPLLDSHILDLEAAVPTHREEQESQSCISDQDGCQDSVFGQPVTYVVADIFSPGLKIVGPQKAAHQLQDLGWAGVQSLVALLLLPVPLVGGSFKMLQS